MVAASEICPLCGGSGRIGKQTATDNGRKGGNVTLLRSQEPGQLSMMERGLMGGRPKALTLGNLETERTQRKDSSRTRTR